MDKTQQERARKEHYKQLFREVLSEVLYNEGMLTQIMEMMVSLATKQALNEVQLQFENMHRQLLVAQQQPVPSFHGQIPNHNGGDARIREDLQRERKNKKDFLDGLQNNFKSRSQQSTPQEQSFVNERAQELNNKIGFDAFQGTDLQSRQQQAIAAQRDARRPRDSNGNVINTDPLVDAFAQGFQGSQFNQMRDNTFQQENPQQYQQFQQRDHQRPQGGVARSIAESMFEQPVVEFREDLSDKPPEPRDAEIDALTRQALGEQQILTGPVVLKEQPRDISAFENVEGRPQEEIIALLNQHSETNPNDGGLDLSKFGIKI
jgi:hypothetical protein